MLLEGGPCFVAGGLGIPLINGVSVDARGGEGCAA